MPIRTNEFQQLVLSIHQMLMDTAIVTESKYLPDRATGANREVDVVVETTKDGKPWTISIECRDRSRLAHVGWVEEMVGKHADLPTDELILVARQGFTPQAQQKAAFHQVQVLSLSQAVRADWTHVVGKLTHVYVPFLSATPLKCEVIFARWYPTSELPPFTLETVLYDRDERAQGTLAQIGEAIARAPTVGKSVMTGKQGVAGEYTPTITYAVPAGSYISDPSRDRHEVTHLRYKIAFRISKRYPIPLHHGTLGDVPVAFGTMEGLDRDIRITVVEAKGQSLQFDLRGDIENLQIELE